MTGPWRIGCLVASIFYGFGAIVFQVGYWQAHNRINQFTFIDIPVSLSMLVSVTGMWRRQQWGAVLNALCWAAYFAIFAATQTYFRWLIPAPPPLAAELATLIGLPVSLLFTADHFKLLCRR